MAVAVVPLAVAITEFQSASALAAGLGVVLVQVSGYSAAVSGLGAVAVIAGSTAVAPAAVAPAAAVAASSTTAFFAAGTLAAAAIVVPIVAIVKHKKKKKKRNAAEARLATAAAQLNHSLAAAEAVAAEAAAAACARAAAEQLQLKEKAMRSEEAVSTRYWRTLDAVEHDAANARLLVVLAAPICGAMVLPKSVGSWPWRAMAGLVVASDLALPVSRPLWVQRGIWSAWAFTWLCARTEPSSAPPIFGPLLLIGASGSTAVKSAAALVDTFKNDDSTEPADDADVTSSYVPTTPPADPEDPDKDKKNQKRKRTKRKQIRETNLKKLRDALRPFFKKGEIPTTKELGDTIHAIKEEILGLNKQSRNPDVHIDISRPCGRLRPGDVRVREGGEVFGNILDELGQT